ncbi:unnamed protein product [Paramecium pentaurelia]|uniref:Uncharacterized protein n=1 Tax=Paramecium pentaurelia TaxID=43138 RepID=A0A8S1V9W9_9CILI|nr:unnamed protein product [Paramecium pentaurelia]
MSTKTCKVNPNIKVFQLKQQIAQLTDIREEDQILILNEYTLEDDRHLFSYNPEDCQFIYVNRENKVVEEEAPETEVLEVQKGYNRMKGYEKLGIVHEDSEEEDENKKKSTTIHKSQMDIAAEFIKLVKCNDIPAVKAMVSNHKSPSFDIINDRQYCGFSGFHYANQFGHEELVVYFIDEGADINFCTKDRQSPLQLALKNSKIECAKLLLSKQVCDVNYCSQGKSALQLAVQKGELDIVELILKHPQFDVQAIDLNEIKGDQYATQLVTYHCQQKLNKTQELVKPKAQKGYIKKVNVMKFFHYKRYLTLDPEAGTLCRYKTERDCPLNPIEMIALSNVVSVWNPKREWYMKGDHEYLSVQYKKSGILILQFCSKSKSTILSWKKSIEDSILYYKETERRIAQLSVQGDIMALNQYIVSGGGGQFNIIADSRCQSLNDQVAQTLQKEAQEVQEQQQKQQQVQQQVQQQQQSPIKTLSPIDDNHNHGNNEQYKKYLINYTIIKQVGEGAFGKVFLVKYNPTNQVYAMKQLNKRKLLLKKQVKFAVTECEILKQVDSPYIVNLFQSFQTLNNLYLVMDYCGGGDLSFHLYKHKTFKEAICKIIIRQLMKAVEYLHSKDILYRDLKPENVLLDNENKIKLVDFGLSKQIENGKARTFCGSPAYLAPEVLSQKGAVQATDVYGIGTVLYELLVGEPPYFNEDLDTLYNNIRNDNLEIPSRLSKSCQSLLQSLLQKEANKRIGCKIPSQVNWSIIKQHEWLDWNNPEEKVNFGQTQENLVNVMKNSTHNMGDSDYSEENYKLNRIVGWTFARVI